MGEQAEGARDLLQQRAEMARRLRQKLTDPLFRSAVKETCVRDSPESSWPSNGPPLTTQSTPPPSSPVPSQATSSGGRASSNSKVRPSFGSHTLARRLARQAQQSPQAHSTPQQAWDNRFTDYSALTKQSARGNSTPSSPRVQRLSSGSVPQRLSSGSVCDTGNLHAVRKMARPHSAGAISKSEATAPRRPVVLNNAQPIPLRGRRNEIIPEVKSRPSSASEKLVQRPSSASSVGRPSSTENLTRRSSQQSLQGEVVAKSGAKGDTQASSDALSNGVELQQQLQAAGEHILSLEREQRELIGNGLRTIALSSLTSLTTPVSPPKVDATHLEATPQASMDTPGLHRSSLTDLMPSPTTDDRSAVRRTESRWSIFSEGGLPLPGESRTSDAERPTWLLEDGRLRAARLEGENHALRKAVARARSENDELAERRRAAEERSEHLQSVSQSLCLALLDIARLGEGNSTASAQAVEAMEKASVAVSAVVPTPALRPTDNGSVAESLRRAVNMPAPSSTSSTPLETLRPVPLQTPSPASCTAAESLRRVVNSQVQATDNSRRETEDPKKCFYIGSPQSPQGLVQQEEVARHRLLAATMNVDARMEEIFARRSKLQALCDSKLGNTPNNTTETEPPTEAESTAASGESTEGIFPFTTF